MAERLAAEPSPYLQQHRDNPVDWWPWGDAAFEEAARRDVPVFLSVGYSTCHWCHVMAHESFEDDQVARLLNDHFVAIKVDREERPDVDAAYMAVCQAMTGSGGWPLTVLLTPERRPFFAGTYFPRASHPNRIGMLDLLPRVAQVWRDDKATLEADAEKALALLEEPPRGQGPRPSASWLDDASALLAKRFDPDHGGFGGAPKFPTPHQLRFLLRRRRASGDDQVGHMVEVTLDAMARGGIHDHVGGGFHRYSTDRRWFLPHFEKMLYDQAGLLLAYAEAAVATGDARWQRVCEDISTYLLRDLRGPDGAFYSAEDADSEGEEGRFYLWSWTQLHDKLGDDAPAFCRLYGVTREGNHHDEATGKPTGRNVLHRTASLANVAGALGTDTDDLQERMTRCLARLREVRSRRVRPLRDEKVLTDWNGLAIAALARAGAALRRPEWTQAADDAASFLLSTMWDGRRLRHRFKDGLVDDDAFLDDHAFLAWGLLELFEATQAPARLVEATRIVDVMLERFGGDGALWLSPHDGEELVVRRREAYDGAMPSGNSVAVDVLRRIARLTGQTRYEEAAWAIVKGFGEEVAGHPAAFTALLVGLEGLLTGGREVVVVGEGDAAQQMLDVVRTGFHPDTVLLHRRPRESALDDVAPWSREYAAQGAEAAAFVCRDHACERPVTSAEELGKAL